MTLREIFNSILDTNLETLFLDIVSLIGFFFWSIIVVRFFWHLNRHLSDWWSKKNPFQIKSEDSAAKIIILLVPSVLFEVMPSAIVFSIGMVVWVGPIFWIYSNLNL